MLGGVEGIKFLNSYIWSKHQISCV